MLYAVYSVTFVMHLRYVMCSSYCIVCGVYSNLRCQWCVLFYMLFVLCVVCCILCIMDCALHVACYIFCAVLCVLWFV